MEQTAVKETAQETTVDFINVRNIFKNLYQDFLKVNRFEKSSDEVRTISKTDVAYTCIQIFMDIITEEEKLDHDQTNQYAMAIFGPMLDQIDPDLNQQIKSYISSNPQSSYASTFAYVYSQNKRVSFTDIPEPYLNNSPILKRLSQDSLKIGDIKTPNYKSRNSNN